MITNEAVFQEGHVPRDLVHRNDELNTLAMGLRPALEAGEDLDAKVGIYGGTGLGKTCTARFALRQLDEEHAGVATAYVNCWEDHASWDVLAALLQEVASTHDLHRRSTPKAEVLDRLRDAVDRPMVAVLDEVDRLDEPSLLYDLHQLPRLSLVWITNRERDLLELLDDRLHSRLRSGTRVHFDPYPVDELTNILRARAREGLEPGVVTDETLDDLADRAAGEARLAIQGLYRAALIAADRNSMVTAELLDEAIAEARVAVRQKTSSKLTAHERVLLEAIREAGPIGMGDLYDRYADVVDEPRTDRQVRNYLTKMVHYNLIEKEGEKRGRIYRAVGEPE